MLIDHGPAGLTLRRIARVSGVSTSSILHHLGSREHLLRVAVARTGQARIAALKAEAAADGILAFVPRSDREVLDTRAWLAWLELWRSQDFLGRWVADTRADEMALLAATLDFQMPRLELEAATALIDGLRTAICAPCRPLRREDARRILATWAGGPGSDVTPRAAGGSINHHGHPPTRRD